MFFFAVAPSGDLLPVRVTQQPDGCIRLEYTSMLAGKRHCLKCLFSILHNNLSCIAMLESLAFIIESSLRISASLMIVSIETIKISMLFHTTSVSLKQQQLNCGIYLLIFFNKMDVEIYEPFCAAYNHLFCLL